jgi:hypothetical protein
LPCQAVTELIPVARGLRRPSDFRNCRQPRKREELDVVDVGRRLGPQRCLDTEDCGRRDTRHVGGIPVVCAFDRNDGGPREADRRVFIVLHVQVRPIGERHDQRRARRQRWRRRGVRPPVLDDGSCDTPGGCNLVPPNHLFSVRAHDVLHPRDERGVLIARQRLHLVTANVKVRPRRDRRNLSHDIRHEPIRGLGLDAQRAETHLDAGVQRACDAVAIELGVRRQCGIGVTRHIDLGHDGDEAGGGVLHDVGVFRLCVIPTGGPADFCAPTVKREVGPRLDLESPSLIVGEVQVQAIQLV